MSETLSMASRQVDIPPVEYVKNIKGVLHARVEVFSVLAESEVALSKLNDFLRANLDY